MDINHESKWLSNGHDVDTSWPLKLQALLLYFRDMSWPIWHAGLAVAGGFLGRTVVQHVQLPLGFVTWMWVIRGVEEM